MATLDDIVAATEILAQESETVMNDSESKNDGEKVEHEFRVGDFVWAKIKSHPWWPGQVYDPKDASDIAVKHRQEGDRLLVAFFGDGSCSWCLPSQVVPFVEKFQEMSMDGTTKSFQNAVEKATDAIGRLVESKMTCNCVPLDKREGLARPVISNAGVKAGVLMPEVDITRLSIPKYEPDEMLEKLSNFAKKVSVGNVFELAVLRSNLSAFYRSKGGHHLPVYKKPFHIEGLEEKKKESVTQVANDFSVPIEVPIMRPSDDEEAVNTAKSQGSGDDKTYRRKKHKSVAKIMQETKVKEEPDVEESSSPRKRRKNGNAEEGSSKGASSKGRRGRKRKEEIESPAPTNEESVSADSNENSSGEVKEEVEILTGPRERKKSKYLSPPYTNPIWRIGSSSVKMEPFELPPVSKSVVEKECDGQLEARDKCVETNSQSVESEKRITFSLCDVDLPVEKLLLDIKFAALHPLELSKEGSLNMVKSFTSAFRSSTCLDGPNYDIYQQWETDHKGKGKMSDRKSSKAVKRKLKSDKSKLKAAAEIFRAKLEAEDVEGNTISPPSEKPQPSQPANDVMIDVKITRRKLEMMTVVLEKYLAKFSVEDKSTLKNEMKRLMDDVELVCEKVRVMAENTAL